MSYSASFEEMLRRDRPEILAQRPTFPRHFFMALRRYCCSKSVDIWRTVHPKTTVVPTLPRSLGAPLALTSAAFVLLFVVLLTLRVRLAERQAELDEMYLALEE